MRTEWLILKYRSSLVPVHSPRGTLTPPFASAITHMMMTSKFVFQPRILFCMLEFLSNWLLGISVSTPHSISKLPCPKLNPSSFTKFRFLLIEPLSASGTTIHSVDQARNMDVICDSTSSFLPCLLTYILLVRTVCWLFLLNAMEFRPFSLLPLPLHSSFLSWSTAPVLSPYSVLWPQPSF